MQLVVGRIGVNGDSSLHHAQSEKEQALFSDREIPLKIALHRAVFVSRAISPIQIFAKTKKILGTRSLRLKFWLSKTANLLALLFLEGGYK